MKLFIMLFHSITYYFQLQKSQQSSTIPNLVYWLSSKLDTKLNTPASIKTLGKHTHTHVCIKKVTFSGGKEKYDDVVHITQHSFPLNFLILQS